MSETSQPQPSEDISIQERLRSAAKSAVEAVLDPSTVYAHVQVPQWVSEINKRTIEALLSSQRPHERLAVNTVVVRRSTAPFYSASAAYWNDATDSLVSYRWTNADIVCVVTVFALVTS